MYLEKAMQIIVRICLVEKKKSKKRKFSEFSNPLTLIIQIFLISFTSENENFWWHVSPVITYFNAV